MQRAAPELRPTDHPAAPPVTERVCFVHVGMHKTGSTAIQRFLCTNADALAAVGIFVPRSGRHGWGHHAVAWDLLGADPSTPASGTLEALIDEVRCCGLPVACISSEEFAHLYRIPNNMQRLHAGLRAIGYRPVIIAYLRPQADYLEALYAEVGKHAPVRDFWDCYREVLANGAVDLWHDNYFAAPLDYDRHFLAPFRWIFGPDNVIVRPFRRYASAERLIGDFLRVIAGPRAPAERFVMPSALDNVRADFSNVVAAIGRNRPDLSAADGIAPAGLAEGTAPAALDADEGTALGGPFEVFRPHEILRLAKRFLGSNLRLFARTGIFVGCISRTRLLRLASDYRRCAQRVRALRALFARTDAFANAVRTGDTAVERVPNAECSPIAGGGECPSLRL